MPYANGHSVASAVDPYPALRRGSGVRQVRAGTVRAARRHRLALTWPGAVGSCALEAQTGWTGSSDPVEVPMSGYEARPPELIPMLSRGKHRGPRTGACFMELASYLAGERWSDRPACTHPLLAAVARDVNDYTSDTGRAQLAGLIPSVIGLTSEDLHIDARFCSQPSALQTSQAGAPVSAIRSSAGQRSDHAQRGRLGRRPVWEYPPWTRLSRASSPVLGMLNWRVSVGRSAGR